MLTNVRIVILTGINSFCWYMRGGVSSQHKSPYSLLHQTFKISKSVEVSRPNYLCYWNEQNVLIASKILCSNWLEIKNFLYCHRSQAEMPSILTKSLDAMCVSWCRLIDLAINTVTLTTCGCIKWSWSKLLVMCFSERMRLFSLSGSVIMKSLKAVEIAE